MVQTQSASEIRCNLDQTKVHITQTVEALETRMHEIKDWRFLVQHYPLQSMVVFLSLGFTLSGVLNIFLLRFAKGNLRQIATVALTSFILRQIQNALLKEA
jgi:hypothetical protein